MTDEIQEMLLWKVPEVAGRLATLDPGWFVEPSTAVQVLGVAGPQSEDARGLYWFRWFHDNDTWLLLRAGTAECLRVGLVDWCIDDDEWYEKERDEFERLLQSRMDVALRAARSVLGAPDYRPVYTMEDCPCQLFDDGIQDVAVWLRPTATISLQALGSQGDAGPWIIQMTAQPPRSARAALRSKTLRWSEAPAGRASRFRPPHTTRQHRRPEHE
jgi:hypothetical protein